jgi:histidinol-phosphate aminotransferase
MQDGRTGPQFGRALLDVLPPSPPSPAPADLAAELGVERVVNLSLNEGPHGPFPAALEAIERIAPDLNRYPSRGSYALTVALAERLGVEDEQVVVAAGADAVIGYACQAGLEPGDEVVVPWPSFPSFVRDAQKRGARPVTVPLRDGAIDLDGVAGAIGPRTRLVFLATPNNPTGLVLDPGELQAFVDAVPAHVLPVVDEAYVEYLQPGSGDAVSDLLKTGRRVLSIRTFSKMYGLAGLRVGYGVGPADVIDPIRRVQRGYDVNAAAQAAALACLDDGDEVARRRALNQEAVELLEATLRAHGLAALAGSAANFVLVEVGEDADALAAALRGQGVIVQPAAPFGAPTALRITAGSPEETRRLGAALEAVGRPKVA